MKIIILSASKHSCSLPDTNKMYTLMDTALEPILMSIMLLNGTVMWLE